MFCTPTLFFVLFVLLFSKKKETYYYSFFFYQFFVKGASPLPKLQFVDLHTITSTIGGVRTTTQGSNGPQDVTQLTMDQPS
jgi:hypothetical protein